MPSGTHDARAAAALLDWYALAGIDTVMLDAPRDRFAETAEELAARAGRRAAAASEVEPVRAASAAERSPPPPPRPTATENFPATSVTVPDDIAIADAHARAASSKTLAELETALAGFQGCNLRLTARSMVFGAGREDADIMLIGEAPDRDEDVAGEPFVGKPGQMLNRMLAAIGLAREDVRLANAVPWRPAGNRPPTALETQICLPFIARQIELVQPKIVVCLGPYAAKAILDSDESFLRLRGHWQTYSFGVDCNESIPALPMLSPTYLLKHPNQKKHAWRDLISLKERFDALQAGAASPTL